MYMPLCQSLPTSIKTDNMNIDKLSALSDQILADFATRLETALSGSIGMYEVYYSKV